MTIGEKIRRIRHIKGLKQEAVAELLGMSNNGYGKIERNEGNISIDRLQQIAKIFEMDAKEVLDFDEKIANRFIQNSNKHSDNNIEQIGALTVNERKLYEETISSLKDLLKMKDEMIEEIRKRQ